MLVALKCADGSEKDIATELGRLDASKLQSFLNSKSSYSQFKRQSDDCPKRTLRY